MGRKLAGCEKRYKYLHFAPRFESIDSTNIAVYAYNHLREYTNKTRTENSARNISRNIFVARILFFERLLQPYTNDLPPSITQGAALVAEQISWLFRTPLMQQAVLSRPAAAPTLPHLEPPHLVHSRGQHALPLSFSPSKPANPLLHSETGSFFVVQVEQAEGGQREKKIYHRTRRCRMFRMFRQSLCWQAALTVTLGCEIVDDPSFLIIHDALRYANATRDSRISH